MDQNPLSIVRVAMQAYVDKDRAAIESVIADDYRFSSPLDNRLDRATYFERCWPNSKSTVGFEEIHAIEDANRAYIVYEGRSGEGEHRFRNCEVHTVRDGKIVETEVYFGWNVPHKAKPGGFVAA